MVLRLPMRFSRSFASTMVLTLAASSLTVVTAVTPAAAAPVTSLAPAGSNAKSGSTKKVPTAPKKLNKQTPLFKQQPRLVTNQVKRRVSARGDFGADSSIRAKVVLKPWRTNNAHKWALNDTVKYVLEVSKPGVKVRALPFKAKGQKKKLMYLSTTGASVVKKKGTYTVNLGLPATVARSLAKVSPKQQAQRIRLTVEHYKDVRKGAPRPDFIQIAQSGVLANSTAARRLGLSNSGLRSDSNVYANYNSYNYSPYAVEYSSQPTQCTSGATWSGTLGSGMGLGDSMTILNQGSNPQGSAPDIMQDMLQATLSGAQAAAAQANTLGPAAATEGGAISIGIDASIGFWSSILQDFAADSCKNLNALWSNTFYASELDKNVLKQAKKAGGGYFALSSSQQLLKQPLPSARVLISQLGVTSSSTWWWNGGDIQANNDAGVAFGGGLVQTTNYTSNGNVINSSLFYQNTTGTDGIVGPEYVDQGSITSTPYQTNSSTGSKGWGVSCTVGNWTYVSPWGGDTWNIASGTSGEGEGGTAFFNANWGLAAATPDGKVLAVVPINNANPTKSNYNSPTLSANLFVTESAKKSAQKKLNRQLNARVEQGLVTAKEAAKKAVNFSCQMMVGLQVPGYSLPSGWPLNGGKSNLFWQSAPNAVFATPVPPKSGN